MADVLFIFYSTISVSALALKIQTLCLCLSEYMLRKASINHYVYIYKYNTLFRQEQWKSGMNRGHDLIPLYQHFITIQTPLSLYIHKIHSYNGSAVFPFKREQFVSVYICVQELKNIFRCCLATFLSISDAAQKQLIHQRIRNVFPRRVFFCITDAATTALEEMLYGQCMQ